VLYVSYNVDLYDDEGMMRRTEKHPNKQEQKRMGGCAVE